MARPRTPPISAQMRHARSYAEQSAALRQLKNDIVGQAQNKERWVEYGILQTIVELLRAARLAASSPPDAKDDHDVNRPGAKGLADHDQVRLQALQLLSLFARGRIDCLSRLWLFQRLNMTHYRGLSLSQADTRDQRRPCHIREHLPPRQPVPGC